MHQLYITHNSEVMLKHIQNIISFLLLLLIFAWTSNSVNINSLTQLHNPCWIVCCQLRKGQEPTNTKNKHIATFSCSSLIERKSLGESDDDYCTGQQEVGKLETKKLREKKQLARGKNHPILLTRSLKDIPLRYFSTDSFTPRRLQKV